MSSKKIFHSLRLSMLSRDRAARAPEKARRQLVFSHGQAALDSMTDAEKLAAYEAFLARELSDMPEHSTDWFMGADYATAMEDGLTLWYPPFAPEKLARLEASLTLRSPMGTDAILASVFQTEPAREVAHMAALGEHGWPFPPRASWDWCRARLAACFPQHLIGKPKGENDHFRDVYGLADGIYVSLQFQAQELTAFTILDPELVRESHLRALTAKLQEASAGQEEEWQIQEWKDERASAEAVDLRSLESLMIYLDELPEAEDIEVCHPASAFPQVAEAMALHAQEEEELGWQERLPPEQQKTVQDMLANAPPDVTHNIRARWEKITSIEDFMAMHQKFTKRHAQAQQARQAKVALVPLLDEASLREVVHDLVKRQFGKPPKRQLADSVSLAKFFHAKVADLQMLRRKLHEKLGVKFNPCHWEGVDTLAELVARVQSLLQHPDDAPYEEVTEEDILLLMKDDMDEMSQSLEAASQEAWKAFEAQLATTVLPAR